ncbi:MAG TPA: hypothetical protein VM261_20050 [Kofleriaceae bacterium]|nr:hypothetical protein [Kofleriaceae bacterium]
MTYRFAAGFIVLLAGCPVGTADDQEIDAGGGVDTPIGASGLTITWDCTPEVPGPLASDITVEDVRLEASSFRIIGDSAPPGDMRTTRSPLDLRWREANNMSEEPRDIELNAPSGLYSRIELGTGGMDEHLTIRGEVRVGGNWRDFELEDRRPHAIVKNIVLTLAPGQHKTVPITVDVSTLLAPVPWDELQQDDGVLALPGGHPAYAAIWAALDASVTLPGSFAE